MASPGIPRRYQRGPPSSAPGRRFRRNNFRVRMSPALRQPNGLVGHAGEESLVIGGDKDRAPMGRQGRDDPSRGGSADGVQVNGVLVETNDARAAHRPRPPG